MINKIIALQAASLFRQTAGQKAKFWKKAVICPVYKDFRKELALAN